MRFGTSALFQSHARGKSGAIIEPGDAELMLPPVLNLFTSVGGAMSRLEAAGTTTVRRQSFVAHAGRTQSGANAGGTSLLANFGAGIWHIAWTCQASFSGTTDTTEGMHLDLNDPDGSPLFLVRRFFVTGQQIDLSGNFTIDIPDETWNIIINMDSTVAGDLATMFAAIICNKLA